jgi:pimeloyl-ACP methyl ester carboxylesterase
VLAVDLRDHGRSEGPPKGWTLEQAAREVEQVVRELDARPVHVVGLSMGGMIGLRWALREPSSVRSLALLSTSAEAEPRAWLHKAMTEAVRVGGRPATRLLVPYAVRQMFSEDVRGTSEADTWRQRIVAMEPGALYRAGQAVFDRGSILDRVDGVDVPALVVVGEHDDAVPPDHGHRLADALDADVSQIPDAGHVLPVERPTQVGDELVHFLRRAETRRRARARRRTDNLRDGIDIPALPPLSTVRGHGAAV